MLMKYQQRRKAHRAKPLMYNHSTLKLRFCDILFTSLLKADSVRHILFLILFLKTITKIDRLGYRSQSQENGMELK